MRARERVHKAETSAAEFGCTLHSSAALTQGYLLNLLCSFCAAYTKLFIIQTLEAGWRLLQRHWLLKSLEIYSSVASSPPTLFISSFLKAPIQKGCIKAGFFFIYTHNLSTETNNK